jgi:vancomycin resistance protein YoaR
LVNRTAASARVEVPITVVAPEVDNLDADLAIAAAGRMIKPLTVYFRDDASWTIPAATLRAAIRFEEGDDRPIPVFDTETLTETLTGFAKDIARPANETLILKSKSGKAFGFVPGKNGRNVDIAATAGQIGDVLAGRADGTLTSAAAAPIVLSVLPPELSAAEASASTHQVSLVGAWTTRFVTSEKNGFGNNIRIPARLINGTVVGPGQVFDFWQAVGPVTFARGFRMGGIIESGRTNPNGAIGGGICSASTTMFNAAIRAGYQVLERDQHSYYINRYPLGLDATVSKYHGKIAQNMRFRNDTANSLYIRGLSGPGWVRFEIYSVPNGRTVSFSRPAVSNVRKAIDTTVKTSSLRRGQTKRAEYPTNGMDVVVIRTVRNSSGAVIHSDRFVSHYIKVNGVLLVGTA